MESCESPIAAEVHEQGQRRSRMGFLTCRPLTLVRSRMLGGAAFRHVSPAWGGVVDG